MISLRLLAPADIPAVMEIMTQPHVLKGLTLEEYVPRVDEVAAALTAQEHGTRTESFGIIDASGSIIGTISLSHQHPAHRSATVTNLAVKQGAGWFVAMQAVGLLVRHAFVVRNLRRLECQVWEGNAITPAIVKRVKGATLEGVRRRALWKCGKYIDISFYGLLREEWENGLRSSSNTRDSRRLVAIRTGEPAECLAGGTATA